MTFGITAFERPRHLEITVASILKRYPGARIVVADNGKLRARLPEQVRVLELPFDCGLSRARNALIDHLQTPYLMLLDDDFVFTDETRIERFWQILESDPEVGCVGGAVRGVAGTLSSYSMDIEVFRKSMIVREVCHRKRVTPSGIAYHLCDMVWNFALFRREMLARHRWHDNLKVGEHAPYFHEVKLASEWRVAFCPTVVCFHATGDRSDHYLEHRRRAGKLFHTYLHSKGLERLRREPGQSAYPDQFETRPNIVVLGVGHSGTTVLSKMLHRAGWAASDADQPFGESVRIRRLNQFAERHGHLPAPLARKVVAELPRPWAIKDPRFVSTLRLWLPYFRESENPPALLRIVRDLAATAASYRRRGYQGDPVVRVSELNRLAQLEYENWPWQRSTIRYEDLAHAVPLFSPARAALGASRPVTEAEPGETYQGEGSPDLERRRQNDVNESSASDATASRFADGATMTSGEAGSRSFMQSSHDDGSSFFRQAIADGASVFATAADGSSAADGSTFLAGEREEATASSKSDEEAMAEFETELRRYERKGRK